LTPRYDEEAMAQIAQMYYIDGITQNVIAKQLGLSRASVCMILSDARECGIVVINIKHPKKYNEQLAASVMQRYPSLKQCYVIPTGITSINMLNKIVASQGTFIVKKELSSHTTVGVAWGSTIYEFMNAFDNDNNLNDIQVIPLIGGTNRVSSEFQLNEMVRKLAEKLQGTPSFIHAPAYAESIEDRELYMNSKSMQDIAEKWEMLDAAIVSIGAMPEYYKNDSLFDSKVLYNPFVIKTMFEQDGSRAVGDICGRRFNIMGQFLDNEHNRKLIAISEERLTAVSKVICIASGHHKVLSIVGGLRTNTIDILITDENTIKSVIEVSDM
jgi:DNA-binding transcriptional regulator LsrR (DeoR family)